MLRLLCFNAFIKNASGSSAAGLPMWPSSSTTIRAVSWSIDWLMVTIMPIFIRALTTSTPLTAILCAKSATVMVSGTKLRVRQARSALEGVLVWLKFEFFAFLPPRTRSSSPLRALLRSRPPCHLCLWHCGLECLHPRSRRSSFFYRVRCVRFAFAGCRFGFLGRFAAFA